VHNLKLETLKGVDAMKGRFLTGIVAGAILGAAAEMIMMPQMSRRSRKRAARVSDRVMNNAMDMIDGIRGLVR
jgi:gas vesicle protein